MNPLGEMVCDGLLCLDVGMVRPFGPKNVDGFISGYALSEGGGTPEGYVCVDDASEACGLVAGSTGGGSVPLLFITPPAANTAGGMACMSCSR